MSNTLQVRDFIKELKTFSIYGDRKWGRSAAIFSEEKTTVLCGGPT